MPRAQPWPWRRPGRPSGRSRPAPAQPLPVGRVYLRVGEIALARGKRNIRQLAVATGMAYTTAHALMRHPERVEGITFETLARLSAYLDCSPADLLGYGPPGSNLEYLPPEPAASPPLPDWDDDGEEDEEYLLPEQWRQVHPTGLHGGAWASEQAAERDAQAAAPEPELPTVPRQLCAYEELT